MKRKGGSGSNPRGQRPPPQRGSGGGGRPNFGPGPGGGRNQAGRRRGGPPIHRGPKACPMCGALVADLKAHIRDRHDDAEAHPRE